jgi:hypothetical protein
MTDENSLWKVRNGRRIRNGCRLCYRVYRRQWETQRRRASGATPRPTADSLPDGTKACSRCRRILPLDSFYRSTTKVGRYSRGRQPSCKDCTNEAIKVRRLANPEKQTRLNRECNRRLRLKALTIYGGDPPRCACCGEREFIFLAIDHINDDGAAHRRSLKSPSHVLRDLQRRGWPPGFQVLCHNCNWAKRTGPCPHQESGLKRAPGMIGAIEQGRADIAAGDVVDLDEVRRVIAARGD